MNENYIVFKQGSSTHRIAFESILFVAVNGHYCQVVTNHQVYGVKCSLGELLDQATCNYLTQVHRSFAVNMQQVTGLNRRELYIHNHRIPLARTFSKEVMELFVNST